tara:strand:+ start:171 stop:677 length:507 start_codon:yes stop_codon:yes gene_type:complete
MPPKENDDVVTIDNIYQKSILARVIVLSIADIYSSVSETLQAHIVHAFEDKCVEEGYVKASSCKLINYSCGKLHADTVSYLATFECSICTPVEGMRIQCFAKNITKAGVRAMMRLDNSKPLMIFLARDHHIDNERYHAIEVGQEIVARVIGQRFELNDAWISIIAELV